MPKDRRIRLHIQNMRLDSPPLPTGEPDRAADVAFQVTPERFAAACERHPDAAACLDATISDDLDVMAEAMREAEVVLSKTKVFKVHFPVPDAPKLKWAFVTSAGVETLLPLDWLPPGVDLINARGTHEDKAGEFALTAILMLNARIPFYVTRQRDARWDPVFATGARGKTVVVIGTGGMGGAAMQRARGAGLRTIGVNRSGRAHPDADEIVPIDRLAEVLPRADFVVMAAPSTAETRGLIGAAELTLMKPEAGLVNIARGHLLDQEALADALTQDRLAGAVLDVFDPEPLPKDSPLWRTPNLIMTPHVSCDDAETYTPLCLDIFFKNLAAYLEGRPMPNRVDPDRAY